MIFVNQEKEPFFSRCNKPLLSSSSRIEDKCVCVCVCIYMDRETQNV